MTDRRFEGVSRTDLEREIRELETRLANAVRDRDAYNDNLTTTQKRCTKLLDEARATWKTSKLRAQVLEFHRVYGQPIAERPAVPSDERVRLRLQLIAEEFCELIYATCGGIDIIGGLEEFDILLTETPIRVDLPEMVDALADLNYVIAGTYLELGVDDGPIADEVQRSNLSKLGADGKPVFNKHGKVVKGPNFSPPDIAGELKKQGWEP